MDEVLSYEGLIYRIINKYANRFDLDDLYQVGMVGLMNAYKHYDKSYDTKFSTFAYYYIVGEVNKYIRENNSLKISKDFIVLKKKILQAKEMLSQKLGREVTNLEVSLFLEVDEKQVDDALCATDEVCSLEPVYDSIPSTDTDTRADLLDLREELEHLSLEEKKLIVARYYQEMTQQETSELLGMSQVQVSRRETKILQKLKSRL